MLNRSSALRSIFHGVLNRGGVCVRSRGFVVAALLAVALCALLTNAAKATDIIRRFEVDVTMTFNNNPGDTQHWTGTIDANLTTSQFVNPNLSVSGYLISGTQSFNHIWAACNCSANSTQWIYGGSIMNAATADNSFFMYLDFQDPITINTVTDVAVLSLLNGTPTLYGINNVGSVVPTGISGGLNYQAPAPEPASLALMAVGLTSLGFARRRRRG